MFLCTRTASAAEVEARKAALAETAAFIASRARNQFERNMAIVLGHGYINLSDHILARMSRAWAELAGAEAEPLADILARAKAAK